MTNRTMPGGSPIFPSQDSQIRKNSPVVTGVLDYFPLAIHAIAQHSMKGNEKHNPGGKLEWARGKSSDHADCIGRHLLERGTIDQDTGASHTVSLAWRALALLQEELEKQQGYDRNSFKNEQQSSGNVAAEMTAMWRSEYRDELPNNWTVNPNRSGSIMTTSNKRLSGSDNSFPDPEGFWIDGDIWNRNEE